MGANYNSGNLYIAAPRLVFTSIVDNAYVITGADCLNSDNYVRNDCSSTVQDENYTIDP